MYGRQTDTTKLIVAFRKLANAPKNVQKYVDLGIYIYIYIYLERERERDIHTGPGMQIFFVRCAVLLEVLYGCRQTMLDLYRRK